jgi:EpsI family protein
MKSSRFWTIIVILAFTLFVLESRGDADHVPPSEPLRLMPTTIANLTSVDIPLTDDTLSVLGNGDFLNRIYSNRPNTFTQTSLTPTPAQQLSPPVSLFIGYFATQRTGQTMHSPQNCLPGAGWTFDWKKYVSLQDVNGKDYRVGEYLISNGDKKQFVIYWYQAHGRSVPNEYAAKAYMVTDAIRMNRTDGALVRVITEVMPNESLETAEARATHFTQEMAPNLPRFIPN